jgi:hypothetical protein
MKKVQLLQALIAIYLSSTTFALSKSVANVDTKNQNSKKTETKVTTVSDQKNIVNEDNNLQNLSTKPTIHSKIPSRIEQSIASNGDSNGTEAKLLLPLYQDKDVNHLVYLDLRAEIDNEPSHQFNGGIGYRKLFSNTNFLKQKQWILGAYGAFGQSYAGYKPSFQQESFGIEALSETYDFRANLYLAQYKGKYLNTSSDNNSYSRNQIALVGTDFELGYKLPISAVNFKLYAGGYFYQRPKAHDAAPAVYDSILTKNYKSVNGQKVRLELKLDHHNIKLFNKNATLTLATEYKHDHINHGQLYALAKISYQFGSVATSSLPVNHNNDKQANDLHNRMNEFTVRSHVVTSKNNELTKKVYNDNDDIGTDGADVINPDDI